MKKDGERLAAMEVEVKNIQNSMSTMSTSVEALHGKFDALTSMITTNYVAKETFEEWKKNRLMERILTIIVTAIIVGLIGFFFRENRI